MTGERLRVQESSLEYAADLQWLQPPETFFVHCTAWSNSCLMRRQFMEGHVGSWHRLTCSSNPMVRCSCAARLARSASLSRSLVSLILRACACECALQG